MSFLSRRSQPQFGTSTSNKFGVGAISQLIRCQICFHSKEQIGPEAQLIPSDQLQNHIATHFGYRPHLCTQCGFASLEPAELLLHSKQTQHQLIQFDGNQNEYLEEVFNSVVADCQRRHVAQNVLELAMAGGSSEQQQQQQQQNSNSNEKGQRQQPATSSSSNMLMFESIKQENSLFADPRQSISSPASPVPSISTQDPDPTTHAADNSILMLPSSSSAKNKNLHIPKSAFSTSIRTPTTASRDPKPYKCLFCNKEFIATQSIRSYHCSTHLDLVLFRCLKCPLEFRRPHYSRMNLHLIKEHRVRNPNIHMMNRDVRNWAVLKTETKQMIVPLNEANNAQPKQPPLL